MPTVGERVLYTLREHDADAINKRRRDALNKDSNGITLARRELGAQIHCGNNVMEGDVFPMIITRVWGTKSDSAVNGQVFLDGNDTLWVTSVTRGEGIGHFV
jgi:hypothetical protein